MFLMTIPGMDGKRKNVTPPILAPRCFLLMFHDDFLLGNLLPRSKGNLLPASVWYVSQPQDFERFN